MKVDCLGAREQKLNKTLSCMGWSILLVCLNIAQLGGASLAPDSAIPTVDLVVEVADITTRVNQGEPLNLQLELMNLSDVTAVNLVVLAYFDEHFSPQNSMPNDRCSVLEGSVLDARMICLLGDLTGQESIPLELSFTAETASAGATMSFSVESDTFESSSTAEDNFVFTPPIIILAPQSSGALCLFLLLLLGSWIAINKVKRP